MIEMTWVADALKIGNLLITLVYFGSAACLIFVALKSTKPVWVKASCVGLVVATFGYLPVSGYLESREKRIYSKAAWERFNKYCAEKAGERFYQKIENVDRLFVMRPRQNHSDSDYADQFWLGDPYGGSLSGDDELLSLLYEDRGQSATPNDRFGFRFLEVEEKAVDDKTAILEVRLRGTKEKRVSDNLLKVPISEAKSRYGYTWADMSTKEDRYYWIAASSLRIVDLETNVTVAERIGYMIDPGFGSTRGGRRPWFLAINQSCPRLEMGTHYYQTRRFLIQALRPPQVKE